MSCSGKHNKVHNPVFSHTFADPHFSHFCRLTEVTPPHLPIEIAPITALTIHRTKARFRSARFASTRASRCRPCRTSTMAATTTRCLYANPTCSPHILFADRCSTKRFATYAQFRYPRLVSQAPSSCTVQSATPSCASVAWRPRPTVRPWRN